jgi:hypothetical protein
MTVVRPRSRRLRIAGHAAVLGLIVNSLSAGCAPSPVPMAAERVAPTEGPIGTVVTPVSVLRSVTPAPPPTGVILVNISTATATPATVDLSTAASVTPSPAQAPVAIATVAPSAPPVAQQAPQQIASPGRVTSVRLSSTEPAQLPCPDPRVVIGVPPVPASSEMTLNCQSLDASEVPPPGPIVGGMVFRLFTDRASEVTLPSAATLGIAYGDTAIESEREADLVIGHLEGTSWVPVPGQQLDPPLDYASATIVELGTYALYLR